MQTQIQLLQREIEELQTKLAFTDMTVEELNQEVIKLNDLVARQTHSIQLMLSKLKAMEPSNIASMSEETPPPHY
ncbi:MAG: SlyX family protein [Plesiomonas shigelloides]